MPELKTGLNILFVCMGNICRSPMAEGALRKLVAEAGLNAHFLIDSAGTTGFHAGEPPDPRAARTALDNGLDISGQRARQLRRADFAESDYLLAMDRDNLMHMQRLAEGASGTSSRVSLLLSHAPDAGSEDVPDPYYGGERGFQDCFELIATGTQGLFNALVRTHFPDHDR